MKGIIVVLTIVFLTLLAPRAAHAQNNCVSIYGQGVVCGVETEEFVHEPVKAGLEDVDIRIVGLAMIGLSSVIFLYSRSKRADNNFSAG